VSTPPAIPRLGALTLAEIRAATQRYHQDGDAARWELSVARTLAKAHQAAYLLGLAERLGVKLDSALLNTRNLSRAERAELKQIVQSQVDYLRRFVDVADTLSEAQINARADLYALAPKQSYWQARTTGADLPAMPGDGSTECLVNCGCAWEEQPDGWYWMRGKNDSCTTCVQREQEWAPYQLVTSDESAI